MLGAALFFLLPAASLTPASLTGLRAEVAEIALGAPDIARREAKGALWTYRKSDCVLFVYLADKGEGLKVTGVSAGARRAGEAAPSVETCLASQAPAPAPTSGTPGAGQ
jgi:hypothetical protein